MTKCLAVITFALVLLLVSWPLKAAYANTLRCYHTSMGPVEVWPDGSRHLCGAWDQVHRSYEPDPRIIQQQQEAQQQLEAARRAADEQRKAAALARLKALQEEEARRYQQFIYERNKAAASLKGVDTSSDELKGVSTGSSGLKGIDEPTTTHTISYSPTVKQKSAGTTTTSTFSSSQTLEFKTLGRNLSCALSVAQKLEVIPSSDYEKLAATARSALSMLNGVHASCTSTPSVHLTSISQVQDISATVRRDLNTVASLSDGLQSNKAILDEVVRRENLLNQFNVTQMVAPSSGDQAAIAKAKATQQEFHTADQKMINSIHKITQQNETKKNAAVKEIIDLGFPK